jgi:hypothetical protein
MQKIYIDSRFKLPTEVEIQEDQTDKKIQEIGNICASTVFKDEMTHCGVRRRDMVEAVLEL